MIHPTPYGELNAVLDHLLGGVRAALGDNFVGLYLQGSFAVGDASPGSDCDFLVVTARDLSPAELAALQTLHKAIHRLPCPHWRNQLEGSYAPAAILRRWSTTPRDPPGELRPDGWADPGLCGAPPKAYPFWYLDHGSDTLVRSEHDNTQVVRWCLREKGVTVAGPDIRELVDPVTPDMLRTEVRATMDLGLAVDLQPMEMIAWQMFWVGLYARMLHTRVTGAVHSKKESLAWAAETLEPEWRGLLLRARARTKGDPDAADPADPEEVAATRAFAHHVVRLADTRFAPASDGGPGGD